MRRRTNFGGNQSWRSHCYQPASEAEVLEILQRHAAGRIRPVGSGHSWSDIAVCDDVSLDMGKFNDVRLYEKEGNKLVRVGAGCRLQTLLDRLHAISDRTLPTLGAIKRQTISGAVSTGTHGSGMQSLSHFVLAVRFAGYDPGTGEPRIFEYREGDELRAARCGLGCTGVILSLDVLTVPKYKVEETVQRGASLEHVLSRYKECPLTQFALMPYAWEYLIFERKPLGASPSSLAERGKALLFRLYNTVWVDVFFHLTIKACLMAGSSAVKAVLTLAPSLLIKGVRRTDDAERILTLGHHYFRHEEMELFVPESHLAEAVDVLRYATEVFAGEQKAPSAEMKAKLDAGALHEELLRNRGAYTHHYPCLIRRLLPEDALISMGSSIAEPLYSISVFTYSRPQARNDYYAFCDWLARCMNSLFGARLHWGKHFPLSARQVASAYPALEAFKHICRRTDPRGTFCNAYTARVLGLEPSQEARPAG